MSRVHLRMSQHSHARLYLLLSQKRLKRKEYTTCDEFANEVELVFSNALEFNLEHSQIWEDASTLRVG